MGYCYRPQTDNARREGAMRRSVFISNVVSISERTQGNPQSRVLEVEVETERGVKVLTLSIAAARQLHDDFAHALKE
jgi:hypothetical protein